ncbi:hypothetical protein PR048_021183 [Dryococelus australis]|uniref:Uncharacterized protein n=1 Tax=Dryococelus australis TaxID=614101 RepID=A0ABQ9GXH8_9NEOP|nr:hypothetical protein PR048_021183 [Dryococelus australis]
MSQKHPIPKLGSGTPPPPPTPRIGITGTICKHSFVKTAVFPVATDSARARASINHPFLARTELPPLAQLSVSYRNNRIASRHLARSQDVHYGKRVGAGYTVIHLPRVRWGNHLRPATEPKIGGVEPDGIGGWERGGREYAKPASTTNPPPRAGQGETRRPRRSAGRDVESAWFSKNSFGTGGVEAETRSVQLRVIRWKHLIGYMWSTSTPPPPQVMLMPIVPEHDMEWDPGMERRWNAGVWGRREFPEKSRVVQSDSSHMRGSGSEPAGSRAQVAEMRGECAKIPEKTRQPASSSGMIPTCENPGANQPGIEPGWPRREASSLATTLPHPSQVKNAGTALPLLLDGTSSGRPQEVRPLRAGTTESGPPKSLLYQITFHIGWQEVSSNWNEGWENGRTPEKSGRVATPHPHHSPLIGSQCHREPKKSRQITASSRYDSHIFKSGNARYMRAAVVERLLERSPPTKSFRVRSSAGSLPDFRVGIVHGRFCWSTVFARKTNPDYVAVPPHPRQSNGTLLFQELWTSKTTKGLLSRLAQSNLGLTYNTRHACYATSYRAALIIQNTALNRPKKKGILFFLLPAQESQVAGISHFPLLSGEIWESLNIEVLRADEIEKRVGYGAVPECKGGGNGRSPRKLANQHDSHMQKSGKAPPGIEPCSFRWETANCRHEDSQCTRARADESRCRNAARPRVSRELSVPSGARLQLRTVSKNFHDEALLALRLGQVVIASTSAVLC